MTRFKVFTAILLMALLPGLLYAGTPPSPCWKKNGAIYCPGDMEITGTVAIGSSGRISEETNTMTFDDGDGLPITLQEIREATGGADTSAIHDNQAGEINAVSQEGSALEDGDALIGENAQNSYAKIKILLSEIWTYINGKYPAFVQTLLDDDNATEAMTTLIGQDVSTSGNPSFTSVHASGGNLAAANRQVVKTWQTGLPYVADLTAVVYGGKVYVCTSSHTAGSTTEPGVGASWATVWEEVSGAGDDLGSAAAADIVTLFGSGSCSGYLKSDGTCDGGTGSISDLDDLPGDTGDDNLIDFALLAGVQAALTNPLVQADVDDTPVNGVTTAPVSSNWAYDHAAAADPHSGYLLESIYDAYSIVYADTDNTPARLTVGASTMVGRQSTGGVVAIAAASQAEMEAGTEAALRAMSPLLVAQAITALASTSDTIGWDYTALAEAPASPVAGKVYRANGAASGGWDPLDPDYNPDGDADRDYFVLYTGSTYVGIVDIAGNLLLRGIDVASLDVSANVASILGADDYAAIRTLLGLVIGTNVQAYDADLTTWAGVTPSANGQSLVAMANYATMFGSLKQAATDSATGVLEIATIAETSTGTSATLAVTPDGLANSIYGQKEIGWTVYDSDVDTAVADGKQAAAIPASMNGMNLIDVTCSVSDITGATSGATTVVLRRVRGATAADMTSTGVTIDYNAYTASDETVDTGNDDVQTGDKIFVDVNAVSAGAAAKGLYCTAVFQTP